MKENQRVRLSKKMLRESLIKLLSEKNIHKISVREICENAEINRTTFYKYYGSPYDLLNDIEDQFLIEIDNFLVSRNIAGFQESQRLTKTLTFINDNLDSFRMLFNNNVDQTFPEKLFGLPQIRQRLSQRLDLNYTKMETDYIFTFIVNGGFSMIRDWVNKDERESAEEMAAVLNQTIGKLLF